MLSTKYSLKYSLMSKKNLSSAIRAERVVGNGHKVHTTVGTGSQKHRSQTTAGDVSSRDWCFWLLLKHWSLVSQEAQSKGTAQAPERVLGQV